MKSLWIRSGQIVEGSKKFKEIDRLTQMSEGSQGGAREAAIKLFGKVRCERWLWLRKPVGAMNGSLQRTVVA